MPTTLSSSDRADIDKVLDKVLASKEDPKTARTLLRATIAEQVAIADVMRQHIKAHATLPGVFEYDENWSDARCIEEAKLNRPLSEGSAASVRKSMFGPLVTKTASGPIDHRVAALEATVAELRAQLTELQDHITRGSK